MGKMKRGNKKTSEKSEKEESSPSKGRSVKGNKIEELVEGLKLEEKIDVKDIDTVYSKKPEEEVKKVEVQDEKPKEIRWRKTGGGSFRLGPGRNHKIIKQNQVFLARPDEIPLAFRDTIIPVDALEEKEGRPVKSATHYKIVKVEAGEENLYDVINSTSGKPMNQKPFDLEKANSLLEALS